MNILSPGHQVNILYVAIGIENDRILDKQDGIHIIRIDGYLNKNIDGIFGRYFDIADLIALISVNIQTKYRILPSSQTDV